MNTWTRLGGTLLALSAVASAPAIAAACRLVPVAIEAGVTGSGRVGAVSVELGTADDAGHPKSWLGPLRVAVGDARACAASDEVAIIEGPVMFGNGILYVPTFSGSNNRLYAVDARSCRVLWRSAAFAGPTRFAHARIAIGGSTLRLDAECRLAESGSGGR